MINGIIELFKLMSREWPTIKRALLVIVSSIVISSGLTFIVTKWWHSGIIKAQLATIKALETRLDGKDDLIVEYRERLHLVPTDSTKYTSMTNMELKKKALGLVSCIRPFRDNIQQESTRIIFQSREEMMAAETEEEKQKLWHKDVVRSYELSNKYMRQYETDFMGDTILVRDEMFSRLPEHVHRPEGLPSLYYRPTNPLGINLVATDLERLAHLLPGTADEE